MTFDLVVPSAGRPSLAALLAALARGGGPWPERAIVVDDRRRVDGPLPGVEAGPGVRPPEPARAGPAADDVPVAHARLGPLGERLVVVRGEARGPAAARNAGWRAGSAEWVCFLDDDVVPEEGWAAALARDLAALPLDVAGSQGRIRVPPPDGRRPTDWERNVAGLEHARWATADLAYRRAALQAVGGFDERFPRAYREDADLGLRLTAAGLRIVRGAREVLHPARTAPASVSLSKQAGNADDVLMRALHGRDWRRRAGAPAGRRPSHLATAAAGTLAAGALVAGRRPAALAAGAAWLAGTADFARARISPGPRTPREVAAMLWTSALIPFAAAGWWLWGLATLRRRLAAPGPAPGRPRDTAVRPAASAARPTAVRPPATPARPTAGAARPTAVLFDRDGTLVVDVPYNGDPDRVQPMPGARDAVDRLRAAGVRTGVVSNQSGVARGLLTPEQVAAVNRRVEDLLGPLGTWAWCPHGPDDGCACRKPAPGLILRAAAQLGVPPARCAVVGDIGADVEAARAAGARAVLVPTPRTRPEEVAAAPEVAPDLGAAVALLLEEPRP